jgi:UDP:flavonoid glycosyltransferase YjiC (YdhE family)
VSEAQRKILFVTSNGTGLGHLNRSMAIARRLPDEVEPVFFTLSQAVPVVAASGFRVEYFPSYRRPASGSDWQWNMRLRRRLEVLLEDENPDLVVFDGVHPYRALTHVLSADEAPTSVWCRRPLWRAGSSKAPLQRSGAFDAVLEPGELAAERDRGPTAERREEVIAVDPIVFCDTDELLSRAEAAEQLGLDPERTTALVNLGQGGATAGAVARVLRALAAEPDLQVAALRSSIGPHLRVPSGVVLLDSTFPMSRYFRAFDLAVAAAGYNAFHELIAFAVPTLFVPMPRDTDDQAARAEWAAEAGVGRAVEGPADESLEKELEALLDAKTRARIRAACESAYESNGAVPAARAVARLAAGRAPEPAVRRKGALNRWLRFSSYPIGPSMPIALAQTARDRIYSPERGRPRAVVFALGEPERDAREELEEAIDSFGVPRDRVLVVTDSFDFATLRELGVPFRRIPAPGELGLEFDDGAYRELLERRLDQALAPWHGRWAIKRIGTGNQILREEAAAASGGGGAGR